jgi:DNA-binding response OmpR family regulator
MEEANFNPKKLRILVIDDDIDLAHTLKEMLELDGASADVAYNGSEGIFQHIQAPYDLIITDIVMPVMDGLEVIMWIKENSPTTKLLVVSGGGYFDSREYLLMAKELGANYVLQKPYSFYEIQSFLKNILTHNSL